MELPSAVANDPNLAAPFRIYAESWESTLSSLLEVTDLPAAINYAAARIHHRIFSSADPEETIYCSVYALYSFFIKVPQAIDCGLNIFSTAVINLPDSIHHRYGKGAQGAINILKRFLVDSSTFFQGVGGELGQETADDRASLDASNIVFQPAEVSRSGPAVLERLEMYRKKRTEVIVLMTMIGRCHAMDLARLNRGKHIGDQAVGLVDLALSLRHEETRRWSKADFTASCTMLRSCARSLIASLPEDICDSTVSAWKEGFSSFIHAGEGGQNVDEDFAVKLHAARVLQNLNSGPVDETSEQLFALADWVF